MGRLLIIVYKNKNVTTREKVRDVDILTGSDGQSICFDELALDLSFDDPKIIFASSKPPHNWKERTMSLSDVKKVIYDGVTIWEADDGEN